VLGHNAFKTFCDHWTEFRTINAIA
jgi:hypothetical protein